MSNGEVCCILGLCCPPGSERQIAATTSMVANHRRDWDRERCHRAALAFLEKHDYFRDSSSLIDAA